MLGRHLAEYMCKMWVMEPISLHHRSCAARLPGLGTPEDFCEKVCRAAPLGFGLLWQQVLVLR